MRRIPPLALMAASAILMWCVSLALPQVDLPASLRVATAIALVVAGLALAVAGVVEFRRARTTIDPRFPHKSSALVTMGVFRVTRNPMYVAFALILVGWGVYLASLWSLLVVPAFVVVLDRYQVLPEERALLDRFGHEFERYRAAVRRWI